MAALTLPRIAGETEDAFAKRVVADSQTTRDGAADFGTAFHHGAERVAKTLEVDAEHPAAEWLAHYRVWYQGNALALRWSEKVLVHPEGCYAGTADLLIEHPIHGLTLVDLKTMKMKAGAKMTPYKSWCYQLAAYRYALGHRDGRAENRNHCRCRRGETMNERDIFLNAAIASGCPEDQTRNFVAAKLWLQERQLAASAAARLCDHPDGPTAIGYGGARGGGKSHWLLAQLGADDCQRVPGLKCLLLRKVGKANLEHFEDLRQRLFNRLPHEFSGFRGILSFTNGSRIIAGHFQNEKDIDAYLGLEYDVIGIEEATTLTARKYQDITTCCRTSKPNWRPRIYSTTNPGGVGHAWYRTRFVVPLLERRETETRFIPARVGDNAFNNPEYRRILEGLTGWQKRAWLDGSWDIAAGQYFTMFRRDVHVVEDFDDTRAVEWFAALDYGHVHYTVCLLGCRDGDGNTFILDEHAERLWLPQRHAAAIKAMLGRHTIGGRKLEVTDLKRFVAGADVFSRQSDGTTIAQQYAKHGISLRCANTDRVNGWAEVMQGLGEPDAGLAAGGVRPTLFFHKRCGRLIETLPTLQHDPNRPEDVLKVDTDEDGVGGDDCADCLRYAVATKSRTITQRKLRGF